MRGTVHFFDKQKGYGFITPDGETKDVFVHFSAIISEGFKSLNEGQRVQFVEIEGLKGMQAVEVKLLDYQMNN